MALLDSVIPYLGAAGTALVDLDENKTGADDFVGALLIYAAEVIAAFEHDEDLPPIPTEIASGTIDKISGISRATLIVANSILTVAQFQVSGRARTILKYVNQAIRLLLAGEPVPTPPSV